MSDAGHMQLSGAAGSEVSSIAGHAIRPTVYVVDDDPSIRAAIARLLTLEKYTVATCDSAEAFLARYAPHAAGCIILDVTMPGLGGIGLQQYLADSGHEMPVVFLTACGDVRTGVKAMKCGAFDFLMKPVDESTLLAAVTQAVARDETMRPLRQERAETHRRLRTLTPREHEVLTQVLAGRLNKQIASDLGTVEQTIKVHRRRVMEKMQVRSIAELARLMERARAEALTSSRRDIDALSFRSRSHAAGKQCHA